MDAQLKPSYLVAGLPATFKAEIEAARDVVENGDLRTWLFREQERAMRAWQDITGNYYTEDAGLAFIPEGWEPAPQWQAFRWLLADSDLVDRFAETAEKIRDRVPALEIDTAAIRAHQARLDAQVMERCAGELAARLRMIDVVLERLG
jgi:hypothetical protein